MSADFPEATLIIVMGVCGCGKSTIGQALAARHGWPFLEGDDYHPPENITKMSAAQPLTDEDRVRWIEAICDDVDARKDPVLVLACSALTPFVRGALGRLPRRLIYAHLETDQVNMAARMEARDHFMPADLLNSQYDALSLPEGAYNFDASQSPDQIITQMTTEFVRPLSL